MRQLFIVTDSDFDCEVKVDVNRVTFVPGIRCKTLQKACLNRRPKCCCKWDYDESDLEATAAPRDTALSDNGKVPRVACRHCASNGFDVALRKRRPQSRPAHRYASQKTSYGSSSS